MGVRQEWGRRRVGAYKAENDGGLANGGLACGRGLERGIEGGKSRTEQYKLDLDGLVDCTVGHCEFVWD